MWVSFVVLLNQIAGDPSCETYSNDFPIIVYCNNIHSWDDLSHAQRNYSDGKSDQDVTHLTLFYSEIPSVSEIFVIFPNVTNLDLQYNSLNYLDGNSFENATALRELYLGYNNISSLRNGTFNGAKNIRYLYINNNKIKNIDSDTFAPLLHLETLSLYGNELTQIHPRTFHQLTNLLGLTLANNSLTELHVSTFQQLTKLQELHLFENKLKSLDGRLLSSNSNLELLYMDDCGIEAIERNFFDNLKKLYYVQSEGNVCIDKEFYDISNISSVLPAFQQCFDNYDQIASENVVLCDYKVDPKLGYTCELNNVIYLNDTDIFSVSGAHITNQQDTDVVAVKFVKSTLSKIPSVIFKKFPNLVRLSVKAVGLKTLDNNTFEECGALEEFDASLNGISDITNNVFDKCNSLTTIDLSDNDLRILRNKVFTGTKIESINLDGNKLSAIEPCDNTLGELPSLKYLSIKWNICIHNSYYNEHLNWEFNRLVRPDLKVCFIYWYFN